MRITKVELQNLKGVSRAFSLEKCNLIAAPNGFGKTAVLDAIRLAMLDYVPGDPPLNTNRDIFKLASGPHMAAALTFDDGTDVPLLAVRYEQGRAGSVKGTRTGPGVPVQDFATKILLDPNLYFGPKVSQNARVTLACQLLSHAVDFGVERITGVLRACPVEGAHAAKIVDKMVKDAGKLFEGTGNPEDGTATDDVPRAAQLASLEEKLKAQQSSAVAVQERMRRTIEGLSDLASIEGAMGKLPTEGELIEQAAVRRARVAELNRGIGEVDATLNTYNARARDRQALADMRAAVATLPAKEEELAALEKEVAAAGEDESGLAKQLPGLKEAVAECARTAAHHRTMAADWRESAKESEEWVDMNPEMSGNSERQNHVRFRAEGCFYNVGTLAEKFVIERLVAVLQKKEAHPDAEENAEHQEARALNAESHGEDAADELAGIEAQISALKAGQTARTKKRDQLAGQLAALRTQSEQVARMAEVVVGERPQDTAAAMREELATLETAEREAEKTRDQIAGLANDKARAEQAATQRGQVDAELEVLKYALKQVKQLRGLLVDESMNAGLDIANRVCAGILKEGDKAKLVYANGEICKSTPAGIVEWTTFSGAEKAAVVVGVSAALANRAPMKLLLIDELANFDEQKEQRLLENLEGLVEAGTVDQFVAISPRAPWFVDVESSINLLNFLPADER